METLFTSSALFVVLGSLGFLLLLGGFSTQVRLIFEQVNQLVLPPIGSMYQCISGLLSQVQTWISTHVAITDGKGKDHTVHRIIGSVFYTLVTGLLFMADWSIIGLTVAALGFDEGSHHWQLPLSPAQLLAMGVILAVAFWATVIADLKGLHALGPWQRFKGESFKTSWLAWLSFCCIGAGILGVGLLTNWRFSMLEGLKAMEAALLDTSVDPVMDAATATGADNPGSELSMVGNGQAKIALIIIACLSIITTGFAAVGIPTFINSLFLLCLWLLILPLRLLGFLLWLTAALLSGLHGLLGAILELLIALGQALLAPIRSLASLLLNLWQWFTGLVARLAQKVNQPKKRNNQPENDSTNSAPRDPGFKPF